MSKTAFSPGRLAPRPTAAVVSSPSVRIFPVRVWDPRPQTTGNKRNLQRVPDAGPRFFVFSSSRSGSGRRGTTKRAAPACRNPRSAAVRWRSLGDSQGPMPNPSPSRDRPTQVLYERLFSSNPGKIDRSVENRLFKEFNLLVSGSPWPMKRAVAPCVSPSSASTGGVGPEEGLLGMGSLEVGPSAVRI